MGNIIISNKGFKEIYLTRYYNTLAQYTQNRDNIGFNDNNNPFSDYCFIPSCSTWQNDKIKILSLPDKGKLFYITNPADLVPIYANAFVGQMIVVRDLIDYRVLKFNAEGSYDDQYTGNYLTQFNIERFCGSLSNNIIATVKLNLIEVQVVIGEAYPVSVPQSCTHNGSSPTNYDVWCTGNIDFALSDSNKLGTTFGFIRMLTEGGTGELGLSKQGGGSLISGEILPVTTMFTASLSAAGLNPPSAYPFGYESQPVPANYMFEFSLNGLNDWQSFLVPITG